MRKITLEQSEAVRALEFVAQSAVSHLACLPQWREQLIADDNFTRNVDVAREHHVGAHWMHGVLSLRSGEFLALFPKEGTGFRIGYKNIGNNFHLFTVLSG